MPDPITWRGFHDAALTQEITSGNPLVATHVVGATDPVDDIIYLGSNAATMKLQKSVNPGTDPVVLSVVDAASGSGSPATEFKLSLSNGGLSGATAGASLSLSHTLLSGVANAVPIHVRRTSALNVAGGYADVSMQMLAVTESPV